MVVPSFFDVIHFEELSCYKGSYHVLGGHLSPLDGIGPNDLRLHNLLSRIETMRVTEVILALSPTLEGDATAYYIAQLLQNTNIPISRLATGIPVGGDLDRIDAHTLMLSIKQRSSYRSAVYAATEH
jgi:recombination protein RecR